MFHIYEDDNIDEVELPQVSQEENQVEFDKYVSRKVRMNEGDMTKFGIVKGRKRGSDGKFIDKYHENPLLDSSVYDVQFLDGHVESYFANQIAEAVIMDVDKEGNLTFLFKEFIDHRHNNSAMRADDATFMLNGKKMQKRTTKGWFLCAELSDGSTEWIDLATAKEAYPIQAAEYAVANKLVSEPAFAWWVPYTLRKRDRVIKAVKRRATKRRKTEKFGLEVPGPNDVNRAFAIDAENGQEHWTRAMEKEVKTVIPALRVLAHDETVLLDTNALTS